MNIIHFYARYLRESHNWNREREVTRNGVMTFANWWREDPHKNWFARFIDAGSKDPERRIRFYSIFGPYSKLKEDFDGVKIFFSGENLEQPISHRILKTDPIEDRIWADRRKLYGNYGAGDVDLAIGFGNREEDSLMGFEGSRKTKYIRFPLWLTYVFDPDCTHDDIKRTIDKINAVRSTGRKDTLLLASHDFWGTRSDILKSLEGVCDISIAGKWRNNTKELWEDYDNDKNKYLSEFKFNICPENVDAPGYVTEKIFDAFKCGAIPIYQGCLGKPEPDVINTDAVLLWDFDGDNSDTISLIKRLNSDNVYYDNFVSQPKFKPDAAEYVVACMDELRRSFDQLI
ncbi:glycosyltransferase family 10 domain-containing protein [Butyrivibrio fibrisolvens]|uniref:glycosyltransferase family 10 domain-containing protein n=1 Tax=Butyrivibrio fibrisolvens TaxID=831 RepID=UPI00041B8D84|nr:glycosyltransferase family 10 [Butyrivibrio fibrisolvens]